MNGVRHKRSDTQRPLVSLCHYNKLSDSTWIFPSLACEAKGPA